MNSKPSPDNDHSDTGHSIFSRLSNQHHRALDDQNPAGFSGPDFETYAGGDDLEPSANTGSTTARRQGPAAASDPHAQVEIAFPKLTELLLRVWPHPEAGRILKNLLVDQSGNDRRLPAAVGEELNLLRAVHTISHVSHAELPPARLGAPVNPRLLSTLEARYPHVLARIIRDWRTRQINDTFFDLITDERGTRQGWPADAWEELTLLQSIRSQIQRDQAQASRLASSGLS